jgi:hypothetical protein
MPEFVIGISSRHDETLNCRPKRGWLIQEPEARMCIPGRIDVNVPTAVIAALSQRQRSTEYPESGAWNVTADTSIWRVRGAGFGDVGFVLIIYGFGVDANVNAKITLKSYNQQNQCVKCKFPCKFMLMYNF